MLTINAAAPRHAINETAAPPPDGADPAGFASLLRQTRAAPPPATAAPAPPASAADAKPAGAEPESAPDNALPAEPPAPNEADPVSRGRTLAKSKLRAADGALGTQRGAKPDVRGSEAAGATDAASAEKRSDAATPNAASAESALDPGVMHWLANLQRAATGESGSAKAGTDADPSSDDAAAQSAIGDDSGGHARGRSMGPSAAELKTDADLKDRAAQGRMQHADAASAGRFAQSLTEQRATEKASVQPASMASDSKDAAASNAAASLASAPRAAAEIAATSVASVAAPVTAPDFAQELGLRLSLLARDGVQRAELHLNPAEMGPVSVQIVMDGTQARVDFGADIAATRQAIEAGLPELASALRDAGFTLAGGGVSQHAGGRSDSSGGGSNPGSDAGGRLRTADADTLQRVGTAARRIASAGGVDLFV